jgi:hypothetical protein
MTKMKCPKCGAELDPEQLLVGEFNENIEQYRANLKREIEQESLLKLREKEKIISDLRFQLEEASRKVHQGSMQIQGAVQEEEIIKILQETFKDDEVIHTGTGKNGADILLLVKTPEGIAVGKIYIESKNTRNWSNEWITKLKNDNLTAKADVLVIISSALPKTIERCTLEQGVWVCNFDSFKELLMALRYSLLKLHSLAVTSNGREGKVQRLYSYLTSEEFKNIFESIIDGFQEIKESHQSEQITLKRMWVKREKLMEKILFSSVEFYGNMRAISGEIPMVKMLEAPTEE